MKRLIIASVAVAGMLLVAANSSEAGGVRLRVGSFGHGYNGGYGSYGYPGSYCPNSYPSYYWGAPSYPRWHDTTHLDWHQGGFQRHGNHYHYQPGHWDVHQDGHWHY